MEHINQRLETLRRGGRGSGLGAEHVIGGTGEHRARLFGEHSLVAGQEQSGLMCARPAPGVSGARPSMHVGFPPMISTRAWGSFSAVEPVRFAV